MMLPDLRRPTSPRGRFSQERIHALPRGRFYEFTWWAYFSALMLGFTAFFVCYPAFH